MASKVFSVKFDEVLVARIDAAAEGAGVSRTAYIRGVLEGVLGGNTSPPGNTSGAVGEPAVTPRVPKPFRRYTEEELVERRRLHRLAFGCELANFQVRDEVDADRMRKLLGEDRR